MQKLSMCALAAVRRAAVQWTVAVAASVLAASPAAAILPAFKLYVTEDGPYRVGYEELVAAGLDKPGVPSAGVQVTYEHHPIPTWVEDGGDGTFGPGDWIEFLGEHPPGWIAFNDEHSRYNVYFLRFDATDPLRMTEYLPGPVETPTGPEGHHAHRRQRHYENDFLLQRIPPPQTLRPEETWMWAKLSHLEREPLTHVLDLGDLESRIDSGPVELRIGLRGWSAPVNKPYPDAPDHNLQIFLNGKMLAVRVWNGNESHVLSIPDIPIDQFKLGEENRLTLRVPKRPSSEKGQWLIDVVLLNWIEIDYPRLHQVGGAAADFRLADPLASKPIFLTSLPETAFLLYGKNGSRMSSEAVATDTADHLLTRTFYPADGESSFVVAGPEYLKSPAVIVRERPSRLAGSDNRADYIMIAHRRLLAAIEPLARFHRARGLDVEVVDIQDVYDEFAGGRARPRALRAFLAHAFHRWRNPAPRYVLLVGDASSNGKDVLAGDGSFPDYVEGAVEPPPRPDRPDQGDLDYTPYADATDLVNRQLVPTWSYATAVGRIAGDNYFVAVDKDNDLPDMAIGRFPVVEPDDVAHIVDKTIRYMSSSDVGPWRRDMVFLTNTQRRFQRQSRRVADFANVSGYSTLEIYSSLEEPNNEKYTQQLTAALNQGQLLVHYLGHGGRYVWETGRRDLVENRDLFSLEHLESLEPSSRLPVILSLTCFTAPFDHPEADSIGEKFLRLDNRGAIAVIASSSSNAPSGWWGDILLEELIRSGATVGEALLRAKRRIWDPLFLQSYNLLGDPAVPVSLPAAEISLQLADNGEKPTLHGELRGVSSFSGELLIDLIDSELEPAHSIATPLNGFEFAVELEASHEELDGLRAIRAYAWDADRGVDAAGALDLAPERTQSVKLNPPNLVTQTKDEDDGPPASAEEVLADLGSWWSFEETTAVQDRLGIYHGTFIGRADRSEGPQGMAVDLYGRGFVEFGNDPKFDLGTGDFSIQFWVSTLAGRRELSVILDKRTDVGYHLYLYFGRVGLQLAGGGLFTNFDGPFVADGEWHHVVVSVDRDRADGIRWFLDGRETGLRLDPTPHWDSLDSPAPLYFGGRRFGGGNFDGELDEVAIFHRALKAAEVERLYQLGWEWLRLEADRLTLQSP